MCKANEAAKATAPATADILGDFPMIQAKPPAATVATEDAIIFDVSDWFWLPLSSGYWGSKGSSIKGLLSSGSFIFYSFTSAIGWGSYFTYSLVASTGVY